MEYKIKFKNHMLVLSTLIWNVIIGGLGIFYVITTRGFDMSIIVIFGIMYAVSFIPAIYLHNEYYLRNKRDTVFIDTDHNAIFVNDRKMGSISDIELISLYMPPAWHRNSILRIFAFENYHFARFRMKNGEEYIFTSLLAPRIENVLKIIPDVPVVKKKCLIGSIPLAKAIENFMK